MLFYISTLSSFFLTVLAGHSNFTSQSALAQRKPDDLSLVKRGQSFTNARATWYQTGLGGCGIWNNPDDFIVALNFPMFGNNYPGPQCFKKITIEYNGKTAEAQITDACEACPAYGGIDLSEGLFRYFDDPAEGVISVNWWFSQDGPRPPPPPRPPKHTTPKYHAPAPTWTPKPKPKPKPTYHATHATSPKVTHPKPSSRRCPSHPVVKPHGANNIANLYRAIVGLGKCVAAGASD